MEMLEFNSTGILRTLAQKEGEKATLKEVLNEWQRRSRKAEEVPLSWEGRDENAEKDDLITCPSLATRVSSVFHHGLKLNCNIQWAFKTGPSWCIIRYQCCGHLKVVSPFYFILNQEYLGIRYHIQSIKRHHLMYILSKIQACITASYFVEKYSP